MTSPNVVGGVSQSVLYKSVAGVFSRWTTTTRTTRDARAHVLRSPHRSSFRDARTSSPSTDAEVNELCLLADATPPRSACRRSRRLADLPQP